MTDLPAGWARTTFPDIAEVLDSRRVPLNATERSSRRGSYPYFGANGLVDHVDGYLFEGPHVLLAEDGGHFGEPERGVAYEVDGRFWVNNHAHILKPAAGIACGFLRAWLNAIDWLPFVGGTTRAKLTQAGLSQPRIPLPPLAEQRRIVAKLDALLARTAAARADLDRISALAARYKQTVLAAAFRGDLTADWRSAAEAPWGAARLGELTCDVRYGTAAKCAYEPKATPVLRIPNVSDGTIDISDLKYGSFDSRETARFALLPGDVLVIRSNGSLDLVGRTAVATDEVAGFLYAGYLIRLRLDERRVVPEFVHLAFQAPSIRRTIEGLAKSTSGVNNINSEQLRGIAIPLPSLTEQLEIVRRVGSAFAEIDRLAAQAAAARRLLDRLDEAILAKAFRGELVPQDPADEPASVLLERIRAGRAAAAPVGRKRRFAVAASD